MARPFEFSKEIPVKEVKERLGIEKNYRIRERLQTLLWFAAEDSCSYIADKLGRCRQTIAGYIRIFEEKGLDGLYEIGRGPGRQSQLDKKQLRQILRWIDTGPRDMGLAFNNWDCKRLSIQIKKIFKITLSDEQVRRILHKNKCKLLRPTHKLFQADDALISKKNERSKGFWLTSKMIEKLSSLPKTK